MIAYAGKEIGPKPSILRWIFHLEQRLAGADEMALDPLALSPSPFRARNPVFPYGRSASSWPFCNHDRYYVLPGRYLGLLTESRCAPERATRCVRVARCVIFTMARVALNEVSGNPQRRGAARAKRDGGPRRAAD